MHIVTSEDWENKTLGFNPLQESLMSFSTVTLCNAGQGKNKIDLVNTFNTLLKKQNINGIFDL